MSLRDEAVLDGVGFGWQNRACDGAVRKGMRSGVHGMGRDLGVHGLLTIGRLLEELKSGVDFQETSKVTDGNMAADFMSGKEAQLQNSGGTRHRPRHSSRPTPPPSLPS